MVQGLRLLWFREMEEEMRVLVTGSRDWPEREIVWNALARFYFEAKETLTVVHGACPTGADRAASEWCKGTLWGWEESHPADWSKGPGAGPARNRQMVRLGADVCLAFIKDNSRGASHCAREAFAAGIDTRIWRL